MENDFKLDLVWCFDKYFMSTSKNKSNERLANLLIKMIELRELFLKNNELENEI